MRNNSSSSASRFSFSTSDKTCSRRSLSPAIVASSDKRDGGGPFCGIGAGCEEVVAEVEVGFGGILVQLNFKLFSVINLKKKESDG